MDKIFDVEAWQQVLVNSFSELGATLAGFLPHLVGMLVILGGGWVVSRVVGSIFARLLVRVGLDAAAQRLGLDEALANAGFHAGASALVGRLVFWVLMLTFLLSAVETLGLEAVTATIDRAIAYLPRLIAGALIVIVGLLLSRLTHNLVRSAAATAGVALADQLGVAAQGVVVVLVGVLAVDQLGVDTALLSSVITALAAAGSFGLALSFALGSRDLVRGLLAGQYLRQTLVVGQEVEAVGRRGRVERIGSIDTLFRDEDGAWSVPNARLAEEVLIR
jgi:hypothetical protein